MNADEERMLILKEQEYARAKTIFGSVKIRLGHEKAEREMMAWRRMRDQVGMQKEKIESRQAEIRKKDQEIEMWRGKHSYALDLIAKGDSLYRETCTAKDAQIKDLEQQLTKQQAYIGRLECSWIAKHMVHGEGPDEERLEKAKDELEKIKQ